MRARKKQWTDQFLIDNNHLLINNNPKSKNQFKHFKDQQLHLEIGCGKGNFIIENAKQNPNINFIAVEKDVDIIAMAIKKYLNENTELKNILFLNTYAENFLNIFELNTFSKIYLNFSDPWPKKRHHKKRLTHIWFLDLYYSLLTKNGVIEIKTDNDSFYESTLKEIQNSKFKIKNKTTDLYNSILLANNIPTEYETKFHMNNKNIYKIILTK